MQNVEFKSQNTGTLLRGRFIETASDGNKQPLIIMLTGDGPKGSKSLSWTNMPPKLQEVGISSFLFDFEGLGYSEGDRRNLSLSVGMNNFKTAFDFIWSQDWVDTKRIGVFASSFGACVLLLLPDIANKLSAIGLKSPAGFIPDAYYNEIGDVEFDAWRKHRYSEVNGYEFEVFTDALCHNAYSSASKIKTPCFITQGDNDEIIPLQHTKYLYECLGTHDKQLEIFEGIGHGYSEGDAWERMAKMFIGWFGEKL